MYFSMNQFGTDSGQYSFLYTTIDNNGSLFNRMANKSEGQVCYCYACVFFYNAQCNTTLILEKIGLDID